MKKKYNGFNKREDLQGEYVCFWGVIYSQSLCPKPQTLSLFTAYYMGDLDWMNYALRRM